jgi:2-dehydro-3-deoxyphosphooctonate aldolase (KDO 8-P synthase)
MAIEVGEQIAAICNRVGVTYVYKSSFDKANRTSVSSFRGMGLEAGLKILAEVRDRLGVPVLTDVHEQAQVDDVAAVCDVLQIPAFLCRQTDLLVAAAETGRAVNVKKGQFLSPAEMQHVAGKLEDAGAKGILLTERGTTFGYNNLVVDFRSLPVLRSFGHPVVFDATHSVQMPGGAGGASGGRRDYVPYLARAAVAVGVDGLFMEIHPDPDSAPSDGPNMLRLDDLEELLRDLLAIRASVTALPPLGADA